MAKCKFFNHCPFFRDKIPGSSTLGKMYMEQYCRSNYRMCARYKIATMLGKEKVPPALYPNMFDQAEALLRPKNYS